MSLFPDRSHVLDVGTDNARPNFESLMNDDGFRSDCAAYIENLSNGLHDVQWLSDAWSAHERRLAGEFDGYLAGKVEQDWEVVLPDTAKPTVETADATEETTSLESPQSSIVVSRDGANS